MSTVFTSVNSRGDELLSSLAGDAHTAAAAAAGRDMSHRRRRLVRVPGDRQQMRWSRYHHRLTIRLCSLLSACSR